MKKKENLVIHALDERWTKYRLELKACQKEFSAEVVHDLRVATRRLLAVMEILRTLDRAGSGKPGGIKGLPEKTRYTIQLSSHVAIELSILYRSLQERLR